MRIGIDYTVAVAETAGLARHTRELVAALLAIDRVNDYVLTVTSGAKEEVGMDLPRRAPICRLPFGEWTTKTGWQELRVASPLEAFTGDLDVYHSPNFLLPPLRDAHGVATIHDLASVAHPQYAHPKVAGWFAAAVQNSIKRARLVIAPSYNTKRELITLLGISGEKIEVIYNGLSERFVPVNDEAFLAEVKFQYGIDGPFILTIGNIQPLKNLQRLIEAYSILRSDPEIRHQLILVGGQRWLSDDLFHQVGRLDLRQDVRFLGYVPDEDLPALLSLADVFVFPSLYEGFGLPPLEAMACGTPVVASNVSAMPEVLGNAALLVDPLDVKAMADNIRRLILDREFGGQLTQRGLERSQGFTWAVAAKRHLEVYEKVCRRS